MHLGELLSSWRGNWSSRAGSVGRQEHGERFRPVLRRRTGRDPPLSSAAQALEAISTAAAASARAQRASRPGLTSRSSVIGCDGKRLRICWASAIAAEAGAGVIAVERRKFELAQSGRFT